VKEKTRVSVFFYWKNMARTGRPTKYDPSMIGIAEEYIASCSREQTALPTIEGLALKLGIDDEQISIYAEANPDFSATIKELKAKQKDQLVNDGMYGGKEVNSTMAIFLLKANHNMIETERKEFVGENGGAIKLFVNAGQGFVPASLGFHATPEASVTGGQPSVQSAGMAQESQKNDNSPSGDGQTGTS
jgi:hypothetical protein